MVDTRSLVLIDDGIDINVLNAGRHRLEQRHVATSHHFDENARVLIDQAHLAPTENDVDSSGHCEHDVSML